MDHILKFFLYCSLAVQGLTYSSDTPQTNLTLSSLSPIQYIQSPRFPQKYLPNSLAVYNVSFPPDSTVRATLETFIVKESESCNKDFLEITLPNESGKPMLCGDKSGQTIDFKNNWVTFVFESDSKAGEKGFRIRLELLAYKCYCGQENKQVENRRPDLPPLESRIYGGKEVTPRNRYPWLVSMNDKTGHQCGSTIIGDRHLLMAAHCFEDEESKVSYTESDVNFTIGAHNLSDPTQKGKVFTAYRIIIHEEYRNKNTKIRNDIAIVELTESIDFGTKGRPICLPPPEDFPTYGELRVAGWGVTPDSNNKANDVPLVVTLPQVDYEKCFGAFDDKVGPKEKVICAGGQRGFDSCRGDSGGALMTTINGSDYIVGIVSFGGRCGELNQYGVYTRVSQYMAWITKAITRSLTCPKKGDLLNSDLGACGIRRKPRLMTRIAGGTDADKFEFPWMAALAYKGQLLGGGVVVAPNYILTTGSKLKIKSASYAFVLKDLSLVLGETDLSKPDKSIAREMKIKRIIFHPQGFDLALIEVIGEKSLFSDRFVPICFPSASMNFEDQQVTGIGWGRTSNRGGGSSRLKKTTLKILKREACIASYGDVVNEGFFCASYPGNDMCDGDEGGPVMSEEKGRWFLAGVFSSMSPDGCASKIPGLFIDPRIALDWIKEITGYFSD